MENLTGKLVDRYQILELLGQGGMAMVYKAYDPRLEREVALKIIRLEAFPPEDLHDVRKRFEREAKALAQLSHPNIIKVMDYGEHEGSPFLVMEYLPGGTLKQMIDGPRSWQEAMQLLLPVARGLEYAHQRGIAHRDIKPANILLTENGEPTLSDFGIVKLLQGGETTTLTASGAAVGTPEYMAPEQWTGKASPKSDIYSLGVVLYEIITGRRPYDADTPGELFLKQVTEPLPLPREIVPDLPDLVEHFLLKVLDKEPSERFDDFGAFVRELESLMSEHSFQAQSLQYKASKPGKVPKTNDDGKDPNRRWIRVVVVAIVLIGVVLGGVFSLPPLLSKPENTPEPTITNTEEAKQEPTPTETIAVIAEPSSTPAEESIYTATPLPIEIIDDFGVEMVLVPAGKFMMGSNDGESNEQPIHSVYLDAYWIDKTEVTNAMFAKFLNDVGEKSDEGVLWMDADGAGLPWKIPRIEKNEDNWQPINGYAAHPVVEVSWYAAHAYCAWTGARLPTEAEWEKAARGEDDRDYPWLGDSMGCPIANYQNCVGETTIVGSYPEGASPYGLLDMAGNVSEWVSDWYDPSYYISSPASNPTGPSSGEFRVHRGGSFSYYTISVRLTYRYRGNPGGSNDTIGFRCARDVIP